jgi:hypothetical protein
MKPMSNKIKDIATVNIDARKLSAGLISFMCKDIQFICHVSINNVPDFLKTPTAKNRCSSKKGLSKKPKTL